MMNLVNLPISFDDGFMWLTNCSKVEFGTVASITFWWSALGRQVHVKGEVKRTGDALSDKYFYQLTKG